MLRPAPRDVSMAEVVFVVSLHSRVPPFTVVDALRLSEPPLIWEADGLERPSLWRV